MFSYHRGFGQERLALHTAGEASRGEHGQS